MERNRYETNSPVEVPSFMREAKDDSEKIDRSFLKLDEDEIDEDEEYEEDDENGGSPRRKSGSTNVLLGILCGISVVVAIICLILFISKSNAYDAVKKEYDAYQEKAKTTEERLNKEISDLNKEVETLKASQTETKKEEETSKTPSGSSDSSSTSASGFKAGTYTVVTSMTVRSGAGTNYDKVPHDKDHMSQSLWENTYETSAVIEEASVKVTEIKSNGDQVWGKVGEGCWICLKNGNSTYVK